MRKYHSEWKKKRQEQGLCRCCPEKLCPESRTFCSTCLVKNRQWVKDASRRKSPAKKRYTCVKNRARKDGIDLLLTESEFTQWYENQPRICRYCGVDEKLLKELGRSKHTLTVDRKDNSKGYSVENCCLACHRCNNMKSDFFSEEEWADICDRHIKPRIGEYHRRRAK